MLRSVVLALTVVTGFTGLSYEVTWQKYLAVLLGAHSEATAAVLGLFLGGLSLGYWMFGALTRRLVERGRRLGRPPRLLLAYGAVEAGIGSYCLLFPAVFPLVMRLSVLLPGGVGPIGFAVDVLLAAVLVLPPAALMGGTIPMLTQALARDLGDATRIHAWIYATNTAGAFAGALTAGFVLIHWLGLVGVMVALGATNIAVGALLALLGLRRREIVDLDAGEGPVAELPISPLYSGVALLLGFAMMVFQTILIRVGGLSFGSSEYTFSMVVAVFVLCIALGSAGVSLLPRISRHLLSVALWVLAALFALLYFALETGPYWAHVLRSLFRDEAVAFYPYYLAVFAALLLVIGPPVVLSGSMLPLLFHDLKHAMGDLGARAGRLYSMNTVGSLLGALVGGYALLFWLDLHQVYRIAVAALLLAAAITTITRYPGMRLAAPAGLLAVSLFAVAALPAWNPALLASGTFRERQPQAWTHAGPAAMPHLRNEYSFYEDDPNSSVAVLTLGSEQQGDLRRTIFVNGKPDGNTSADYNTMALAALIPALLAERVERGFVIGFGTGVTAGELAALQEVESVTVAEISAGVMEAAPLFDFANHGASSHPKIEIVRSDAYRALLKGGRDYDVIVSEPSNPWVTGVEMLFSREFLEEARDRLSERGVYCQWFHLYETSDEAVELVLRTYTAVFDHVAVWSVNGVDLLLLGFRDPGAALDSPRIEARMLQPDFADGFTRTGLRGPAGLLAHETLPLGVVNAAQLEGAIHSLYRPRLTYEAGRGFFVGEGGNLPFLGYGEPRRIGMQRSLLGRRLERFRGRGVPERVSERIAKRACASFLTTCETFLAQWVAERPGVALPEWVSTLPFSSLRVSRAEDLARFFHPEGSRGEPPVDPAEALETTHEFRFRYAHAAPFDPGALVAYWQRCGRTGAEDGDDVDAACARGLRMAQRMRDGRPTPPVKRWMDGIGAQSLVVAELESPGPADP